MKSEEIELADLQQSRCYWRFGAAEMNLWMIHLEASDNGGCLSELVVPNFCVGVKGVGFLAAVEFVEAT
ncbi:hypothetical protein T09_12950 [Trichinella sp. T9]|nr:hypothetical protein T09_12950 [Trichinella sp. T9]